MANTSNAIWATSGPAFSFQQLAFGGKDVAELAYRGYITFTGDAATATVTLNWVDGTATPFSTPGNPPTAVAPKAVFVGPTNTASASAVVVQNVSAVTTTGCTLTLSANAPAVSITIPFIIYPY